MRALFLLLFVLSLGMSGCRSDNYLSLIQKKLDGVAGFHSSEYSFVVIIPNEGCPGCISEAVNFYQNNRNDSIFFVFTNIFSRKDFRLNMGAGIENRKNVYIDTKNEFLCEDENINAYPIIVDIRDKSDLSWTYLNPGEDIETMFNGYN